MRLDLTRTGRIRASSDCRIPDEIARATRSRTYPLCGDIIRRFREYNPDMMISKELAMRLKQIIIEQTRAQGIKQLSDCVGDERLFAYQRVGAMWLYTVKRGILADDQGLGKTVEAAAACNLRSEYPQNIAIICTNSAIGSWSHHMMEFYRDVTTIEVSPGSGTRGIQQMSHLDGGATSIVNFDNIDWLAGRYDITIIDEAHHLRNKDTRMFKRANVLAHRSDHVYLLTASPTVNADYDMWTLLHLCDPERFSSYWSYIFRFFEVSNNGFGLKIEDVHDYERDNLDRMIDPYMLHRDESIKELPGIHRKSLRYTMNPEHCSIYDKMEEEAVATFGDRTVEAPVRIAQITRLRQIAISPKILFQDWIGKDKIDFLIEQLDDRPTVIFTAFEEAAQEVAHRLYSCVIISGKVSRKNRDKLIEAFGDEYKYLVLTHGTGGESLTLTQAKRAIFLDLAWHPAGNRHAMKRIHRIGQDQPVEVNVIKNVGSIEEWMEQVVREKRDMTVNDLIEKMKEAYRAKES